MLHREKGNDSIDGVYERERLRRMAKKLGLSLVKARGRSSQKTRHSSALGPGKRLDQRLDVPFAAADAGENAVLERKFDKCG